MKTTFLTKPMSAEYILSLDQGTSSSRAVLFDRFQQPLGIEQMEFTQYYPADGWVDGRASCRERV